VSFGVVGDVTERYRKRTANGRHIDVRTGHIDTYHHG